MFRFRRTPKVRITSLAKDFSNIPEVDWYFREKSSPHDLSMGMEQLLQKDKILCVFDDHDNVSDYDNIIL
jgi:hypothetical protein